MDRARQKEDGQRGKLTVFTSYFSGAGKTYSMLEAARQAQLNGTDVVIGIVSCGAWKQTQLAAQAFETIRAGRKPKPTKCSMSWISTLASSGIPS